ncbi:ethanolamine ammonia-lyase subunit EutC [Paenibacillus lignilyticus]|uniref:Ethanolamine ammonia-lyase small subunit n=1 Tax=Paenibacillus lignilyticus TaxID=1172615 RepID=A0ABS5C9Q9_9BACL|nr:ethanolamine ammonia-lyase subunit EutC [Paenibacillus lignilyticus]MBP3962731.1 ethanolamine ammonia-lyase subunit EutC [Paenibacillus lignilyticus]
MHSKLSVEQLVDRVMAELEKRIAPSPSTSPTISSQLQPKSPSQSPSQSPSPSQPSEDRESVGDPVESSNVEEAFSGLRTSHVPNPKWEEGMSELIASTPARIGVWRAGTRPLTRELLHFRCDHAAAVDSIYGSVSQSLLDEYGLFTVESCFVNTENYLKRPDMGRVITNEGVRAILEHCQRKPQVQIVVSDGLSANAVNANFADVYPSLLDSLGELGLSTGTPFFVRGGRVAVMDPIGDLLEPEVLVLLIGERPGLVSSKSMSAYMCYRPRAGTIESSRTVLSNIHAGGTAPVEAGAHMGTIVRKMLEQRTSGVHLE